MSQLVEEWKILKQTKYNPYVGSEGIKLSYQVALKFPNAAI